MPFYLLITALFLPANLWAAVTPHLHNDLSMRLLHGASVMVLLPAWVDLLRDLQHTRHRLQNLCQLLLGLYLAILTVVNLWIFTAGMGVEMGWLNHLLLGLAMVCVITFYLLRPEASGGLIRPQ